MRIAERAPDPPTVAGRAAGSTRQALNATTARAPAGATARHASSSTARPLVDRWVVVTVEGTTMAARRLEEYPELMTVDEAAAFLRVSRALGYQLARQYRITDGAAGLPVRQVGRCLRVPRHELAAFVGLVEGDDSAA